MKAKHKSAALTISHDQWLRTKIQASLTDSRPTVPHDQVMAEIDAIIIEAEQRRKHA